jgi:beta-N-acetylhexosaminidase
LALRTEARRKDVTRLASGALLASFHGTEPPPWLLRALEGGLGGVVLFSSNVVSDEQLRELTARLRSAAGRPIVVAADEEGGEITRLDARCGSPYPTPAALGRLDDAAITERVASSIARRLARSGVTLALAPVCDVVVHPENAVVGVRSFGADSALVGRHVRASVRGLQSRGRAACAKHFPGHGATAVDSHVGVPRLPDVAANELAVFAAAVEAGVRAVMPGHLVIDRLDVMPATFSARVLGGLLRDELGFAGPIVSDALDMHAAAAAGPAAALIAGCDLVCLGPSTTLEPAVGAVRHAVEQGELPWRRLDDAVTRGSVLAAAPEDDDGQAEDPVQLGRWVAERALERRGALVIGSPPLVVYLSDEASEGLGATEGVALRELRRRWPAATIELDVERVAHRAPQRFGLLVIHGPLDERRIHDAHAALWARTRALGIVDTGVPTVGSTLPSDAYISVLGETPVALRAALRAFAPQR